MNETTRTLTFVGVAGALAAAAFGMHAATRPPSLEEFSDVGTEFYPEFENPRDATGLRVAAYNDDAARVDVFDVDFKNGLWRIPSHHDYPADGEERLANTATSIIGLEREALVSTSADDHKRLGVLDPLDDSLTGTEGRGDRISLTKGDVTLADYIIGKKIEDGPENTYNIRRADEARTYRATLDLDVSTKFADWIEPGLLDFRRGDIRELVIDRYSIDETRGVLVPGVQSELTRSSQDDSWNLKGIDEATQQVKVSTVNEMINALEDLTIVGVRKKPAGLSADLRGDGDGAIDRQAVFDLEQKGFFVDSRGSLVSNEGDVRMVTADGAMYLLRFGEVFTGSDVEIEVGKSSSSADADGSNDDDSDAADAAKDATGEDDAAADSEDGEGSDTVKKSRYVFITAQFDESAIAALPDEPVKPEPPADDDPGEGDDAKDSGEEDAAADESPADGDTDTPPDDAQVDDAQADDAQVDDEAKSEDAAESDEPDPKAEYEQALADYEAAHKQWESQQAARQKKIEDGQQRVQELNIRFADWYYVISAETFDKIRVSPEQLVEPIAADAAAAPGASGMTLPGMVPPGAAPPPVAPPEEQPKPQEPVVDDAKADDAKADDEKPDDAKPAEQKPAEETPATEKSEADEAKPADEKAVDKPANEDSAPEAESTSETPQNPEPAVDEAPSTEESTEESIGDATETPAENSSDNES